MYSTSTNYKEKILADSTKQILNVYIDDNKIEDRYILSFKITYTLLDNDKFCFGSTPAKTVDLKIHKNALPSTYTKFYIESGITGETIPIGYFNVDAISKDDDYTISLTLIDDMAKFEFNYDGSSLDYPATLLTVLQDICSKAGVELGSTSFLNSNKQVAVYDNTVSARTYLSYIAEQAGGFAIIGRDGKLYIKTIGEDTAEIALRLFSEYSWGEKFKVSRIAYEDGVQDFKKGDQTNNTIWISSDNMYIVDQEQIDNIYNEFQNFEVYSFSGTSIVDPAWDIGDILIIDNKKIIFQGELEYKGKFKANIKSDIQAKTKEETTTTKISETKKIRRVQSQIDQAEGNIKIIAQQTTELTQKTSSLEVDVENIKGQISEVADVTVTADGYGTINVENINQSEPIMIRIYPTNEDIIPLRPRVGLYPRVGLRPHSRELIFTRTNNEIEPYSIEYNIPADLYRLGNYYDEFILDYENQRCYINRNIGVNENGEKYLLEIPTVEEYEYPTLQLLEGDYKISLPAFENAYIYVRLMTANIYTSQFATKVELNSKLEQTSSSINLSVDQKLDNYSTTQEMNSAITQKANSITQEVNETINNIQIGGTNLIPNSAPYNLDGYVISNTTYIERTLEDEETAPFGKCIRIRSLTDLPSMLGVYIIPIPQVLDEGKEYCFSLWLKATAPTNVTVGYARGGQTTFNVTTEYKKFTHKFTALAPTAEAHGFAIYLPQNTVPGRQVFVHSIKLEVGNKNTDWSPAPSDVSSKVETQAVIEQTANEIEMTVQQEINTITGENSIRNGTFEKGLENWSTFASQGDVQVTEHNNKKYAELITMNGETKLTQTITGLIEEIDYKLSFKVFNQSFIPTGTIFTAKIWQTKNNSEQLILLKSQEVELNGTEKSINVEFNMLYAGDVDIEFGLNISSFLSEEISAMVTDVVVAGGSISERFASLKVGLDGIESEVSKKVGNNEIISKINQSSEAVGINANKIELSANDVLNLLSGNTISLSGKKIKIASDNFNVDEKGKMTCVGAEISGKVIVGGDEEEPEFIATDGNFRTTVFPLGLLNEVNGEYAAVMKGGLGVGTYTSTGMSEKVTINSEGIIAPKVTQTSLAEQKKNFEKMKDNALNIIKTIDIYKYNLKSEKDTDKKHIGFVIGDDYKYAKEVTSIDNTGVDNYSFTSLCCKAIQEQQAIIEQLKKEIEKLKEERK